MKKKFNTKKQKTCYFMSKVKKTIKLNFQRNNKFYNSNNKMI